MSLTEPSRQPGVNPNAIVEELIETTGVQRNRDLLHTIVQACLRLARDDSSRLDLKIARSAINEMAEAFKMFAPYRAIPKVTIFGSARTAPSDELYVLARDLASRLAAAGWMVVTGAGPGIMAAGNEGAGREKAIGINIRLPFETDPNPWIADDDKLVEMKYFFTRKLMLIKESAGFLVLPGGFGTLDECFELLTLLQTGKAEPVPIVLVERPTGGYWHAWQHFVSSQVYAGGLADAVDAALYCITDDAQLAVSELLDFYSNFHSRRFVGKTMVIRLHKAPNDLQLAELNTSFADICSTKGIWRTEPLAAERASDDHLELERVALEFDRSHHGRLRQLIDELNRLTTGPEPFSPTA